MSLFSNLSLSSQTSSTRTDQTSLWNKIASSYSYFSGAISTTRKAVSQFFNPKEIPVDVVFTQLSGSALQGRIVVLDSGEFADERICIMENHSSGLRQFHLIGSVNNPIIVREKSGKSKTFEKKVIRLLSAKKIVDIDSNKFEHRYSNNKLNRIIDNFIRSGNIQEITSGFTFQIDGEESITFSTRKELFLYLGWKYLFMNAPIEEVTPTKQLMHGFVACLAVSGPFINILPVSLTPAIIQPATTSKNYSCEASLITSAAFTITTGTPAFLALSLLSCAPFAKGETLPMRSIDSDLIPNTNELKKNDFVGPRSPLDETVRDRYVEKIAEKIIWGFVPWKKLETISKTAAKIDDTLEDIHQWLEENYEIDELQQLHDEYLMMIPGHPYPDQELKDLLSVLKLADRLVKAVAHFIARFTDPIRFEARFKVLLSDIDDSGITSFFNELNAELEHNTEKLREEGLLWATTPRDVAIATLIKKWTEKQKTKVLESSLSTLQKRGNDILSQWSSLGPIEGVRRTNEIGNSIFSIIKNTPNLSDNDKVFLLEGINAYRVLVNSVLDMIKKDMKPGAHTASAMEDANRFAVGLVAGIDLYTNFRDGVLSIEPILSINPVAVKEMNQLINLWTQHSTKFAVESDMARKMIRYQKEAAPLFEKLMQSMKAHDGDPWGVAQQAADKDMAALHTHFVAHEQFLADYALKYKIRSSPIVTDFKKIPDSYDVKKIKSDYEFIRILRENNWYEQITKQLMAELNVVKSNPDNYAIVAKHVDHLGQVASRLDLVQQRVSGETSLWVNNLKTWQSDLELIVSRLPITESFIRPALHLLKGDIDRSDTIRQRLNTESQLLGASRTVANAPLGYATAIESMRAKGEYSELWHILRRTEDGQLSMRRPDGSKYDASKFTATNWNYRNGQSADGHHVLLEKIHASQKEIMELYSEGRWK